MRIRAASSLLLLGCLASACSFPSRDNPNDPTLTPIAVLNVANSGLVTDAFGRPVLVGGKRQCNGGDVSALTVFSRGRCVVLDAVGSSARGSATIASYEFSFYDTDPSQALASFTVSNAAANPSWAIAGIEIPNVPWQPIAANTTSTQARFMAQVKVVDSHGRSSVTARELTLTNSAPTAAIPPPPVLSRLGAQWEAPLADMRVFLDGSAASDPDGDPLTYCWNTSTDSNGQPLVNCATTPLPPDSLTAFTDSSSKVVLAQLNNNNRLISVTVSDGMFRSNAANTQILVADEPAAWGIEKATSAAVQAETSHTVLNIPPEAAFNPSSFDGTSVVAYRAGNSNATDRNRLTLAQPGGPIPPPPPPQLLDLPGGYDILQVEAYVSPFFSSPHPADEGLTRFWVFAVDGSGVLTLFSASKPYGAGSFTLSAPFQPTPAIHPQQGQFFTAIDEISRDANHGDLWFAEQFGSRVIGVRDDLAGSLSKIGEVQVDPLDMPSGLGFRAQQNATASEPELWIMMSRNVSVANDNHLAYAHIVPRPGATMGCTTEHDATFDATFSTAPVVAWSVTFTTDRHAWTNLFTHGLALFTVQQPNSDPCAPVMSLDTLVPDVGIGFDYVVDGFREQVTMIEESGALVSAIPGGFEIRSESIARIEKLFKHLGSGKSVTMLADPAPGDTFAHIVVSNGASPEGIVTRTVLYPSPVDGARAVEYSTGSYWVGSVLPTAVTRVDARGARVDLIASVTEAAGGSATTFDLSAPSLVRSDPASTDLYVFTTDNLFGSPGSTTILPIDTRARRVSPAVATLKPGITLPPATGNAPLGYRILDAAVQPSYSPASRLVVAAIQTDGTLHVMRLSPTLAVEADVVVSDAALNPLSPTLVLERNLATNEIVILYRDSGSGLLNLRRFAPDLQSSALFALGRDADAVAASCLRAFCFVAYQGAEQGILTLDDQDQVLLTPPGEAAKFPNNVRDLYLRISYFDNINYLDVVGDTQITEFQAYWGTGGPSAFYNFGRTMQTPNQIDLTPP